MNCEPISDLSQLEIAGCLDPHGCSRNWRSACHPSANNAFVVLADAAFCFGAGYKSPSMLTFSPTYKVFSSNWGGDAFLIFKHFDVNKGEICIR